MEIKIKFDYWYQIVETLKHTNNIKYMTNADHVFIGNVIRAFREGVTYDNMRVINLPAEKELAIDLSYVIDIVSSHEDRYDDDMAINISQIMRYICDMYAFSLGIASPRIMREAMKLYTTTGITRICKITF